MGNPVNVISSNNSKNILINGGFPHWQRGTSIAVPSTTFTYTADRWGLWSGVASAACTASRQAHSDPNKQRLFAIRLQRNAGQTGAGNIQFNQTLLTEDSELLQGKKASLRFRARAGANFSPAGGLLEVRVLGTSVHTDLNYITAWSSFVALGSLDISPLTTTMTDYKIEGVSIPANIRQLAVNFRWVTVGTAGADDWIQLEDVQLEPNESSTQFELRGLTADRELILCQRYYESTVWYGAGNLPGGAEIGQTAEYKVSKRAQPIITTTMNGSNGLVSTTPTLYANGVSGYSWIHVKNGAGAWYLDITIRANAEL